MSSNVAGLDGLDDEYKFPSMDELSQSTKFLKDFKKLLNAVEPEQQLHDDNKCQKCSSHNIIQADGFLTCRDCGIQNSIIIDSGQEWRYYGSEDSKADPARCGLPTSDLLPETSNGSMIGMRSYESYKVKKLRTMQSWSSISYQDNKLISSFNNITAISVNAGISQCIIEEAKHMYKKVYLMKACKRIKLEVMQASSVLWACKIKGVPRDTMEMAQMFNIKVKDMRRGSKLFENVWNSIVIGELDNIKQEAVDGCNAEHADESVEERIISHEQIATDASKASATLEDSSLKPSNSTDYLHRSCSKLGLSDEVYMVCKSMCVYAEDNDLLIKHIPVSRTAGCIYFTCLLLKIKMTFEDIAKICDISEITIKKCYQKINKFSDELVENTLLKRYVSA